MSQWGHRPWGLPSHQAHGCPAGTQSAMRPWHPQQEHHLSLWDEPQFFFHFGFGTAEGGACHRTPLLGSLMSLQRRACQRSQRATWGCELTPPGCPCPALPVRVRMPTPHHSPAMGTAHRANPQPARSRKTLIQPVRMSHASFCRHLSSTYCVPAPDTLIWPVRKPHASFCRHLLSTYCVPAPDTLKWPVRKSHSSFVSTYQVPAVCQPLIEVLSKQPCPPNRRLVGI